MAASHIYFDGVIWRPGEVLTKTIMVFKMASTVLSWGLGHVCLVGPNTILNSFWCFFSPRKYHFKKVTVLSLSTIFNTNNVQIQDA